MVDLHTHSAASDGSFAPAALMREAARAGLSAIALTDHDTIAGLDEARTEAAALSLQGRGLRFIPGIELEIQLEKGAGSGAQFHLLGLGIERPSAAFTAAVAGLSRLRGDRNREMLDRMKEQGIEAALEDVAGLSDLRNKSEGDMGCVGGDKAVSFSDDALASLSRESTSTVSLGRPHFAAYLVRAGLAKNMEQAFARWLVPGKPLFVPRKGLDFDRAAAVITESGGVPVLAHPLSLFIAWGRLPAYVAALKERGLGGLEAWHPAARAAECRRLEHLAAELGLRVTAGSDFHGEARRDRKLGHCQKDKKIDDRILDDFLAK